MINLIIKMITGLNAVIFAVLTVLLVWAAVKAPSKRLRNVALLCIAYGVALMGLGVVATIALPAMVRTMAAQTVMLEVLSNRLDTEKLATLKLTPREVEVLEVMASGALEDSELASSLSIAPSTAATHVRNIMHKAGVKDRRDLLLLRSG